jgi:hypothetical protein
MSDLTVRELLVQTAEQVHWPDTVDLVPRLALSSPSVSRSRQRRWVPVLATVLLLLFSLVVLSPQARQAVADLLGAGGIEIEFEPDPAEPVAEDLGLGTLVSPTEAAAAVRFELSVPGSLGDPDEIYVSDLDRVDMVWKGGEALPAAAGTEIGLLYTQFEDSGEGGGLVKSLGEDSSVTEVAVQGSPGLWIADAPHIVFWEDAEGNRVESTTRLAGNVLMWESDGVTHRIETMLGLKETLGVAGSVRPVES